MELSETLFEHIVYVAESGHKNTNLEISHAKTKLSSERRPVRNSDVELFVFTRIAHIGR